MQRLLLSLLLGIFGFSFLNVFAHPLDVSNTTLTLYDTYVVGVTYIHPVELDRILVSSGGINPNSISKESYYALTGVLTTYLQQTLKIENKNKECSMGDFTFQDHLMIDEIYSGGFPISYIISCQNVIRDPIITINFLNEVPLQTNKLYIYRSISGEMTRTDYKVLNARKNTHSVSFTVGSQSLKDTDGDGLTDEDEILYRTNPNDKDSDGDGYSDGIEIEKSWNPLSKELSPGQWPYNKDQDSQNTNPQPVISTSQSGISLSQDTSVWGGERFRSILRHIRLYTEGTSENGNLWILLLSVGMLGFLHALGPGHSKGILISQIIDEHMSYTKSMLYCGLFTSVHLLDIIVVVVITKLFFQYIDPSVYLSTIAQISAVLVISIGMYLLWHSIRKYYRRREEDARSSLQKKNHIIMAIITGLTPCAFGWSIFLMLLAISKLNLAFPLLISLGIGIFLCLLTIATITWFFKEKIYQFSPRLSTISPIFSSIFIVMIGVSLTLQNFSFI